LISRLYLGERHFFQLVAFIPLATFLAVPASSRLTIRSLLSSIPLHPLLHLRVLLLFALFSQLFSTPSLATKWGHWSRFPHTQSFPPSIPAWCEGSKYSCADSLVLRADRVVGCSLFPPAQCLVEEEGEAERRWRDIDYRASATPIGNQLRFGCTGYHPHLPPPPLPPHRELLLQRPRPPSMSRKDRRCIRPMCSSTK
jgi:hypothetical protein